MKGGGILPMQAFADVRDSLTINGGNAFNMITGQDLVPTSNPTL